MQISIGIKEVLLPLTLPLEHPEFDQSLAAARDNILIQIIAGQATHCALMRWLRCTIAGPMQTRLYIEALHMSTAVANDGKVAAVCQDNTSSFTLEIDAISVLKLLRHQTMFTHAALVERPSGGLYDAHVDADNVIPFLLACHI